jgi:transcriptional regulator with XRE-family HTH domain
MHAWREHKGLSQEDVAKRMKISQESYCRMEKPRARLRQTTRQRIAAALEIEEAQLRI